MKFIKFVSLILAVTFLSVLLPACGEVVTVNDVKLAVILESPKKAGEKKAKQTVHLDAMAGDIKSTDGNNPTVLDAVIQILEENGIQYKLDSSGESIRTIKSKSETTKGGYSYFWEFTVNGEEGKRAAEMEIAEGDVIVYYLIPEKSKGGTTDETDDGTDVEDVVEDEESEDTAE